MNYVDGIMLAVPTAKREAYIEQARKMDQIMKDHGALKIVECWGDDIPDGKLTSMPMAVKCQTDETVVFSWVIWPSKAARDAGLKAAMEDPRMKQHDPTLFDGKRLIYGGFEVVVEI